MKHVLVVVLVVSIRRTSLLVLVPPVFVSNCPILVLPAGSIVFLSVPFSILDIGPVVLTKPFPVTAESEVFIDRKYIYVCT